MSWTPLEPPRTKKAKLRSEPLSLSVGKLGAAYGRKVILTIRPELFDSAAPAFLKEGASVTVLLGTEDDAGRMRVVPGGKTIVRATGGTKVEGRVASLRISFPMFPGLDVEPHGPTPPPGGNYDYKDDGGEQWLDFLLPDWAVKYAPEREGSKSEAASKDAATAPENRTKAASPAHHKPKPEAKKAA